MAEIRPTIKEFHGVDWKEASLEKIIDFARANYDNTHTEVGMIRDECKVIWESLEYWKEQHPGQKITIVEIGGGYYTSGRIFMIWILRNGGTYYSLDIKNREENIKELEEVGVWQYVNFIQGDSQKIFWDIPIDFLLIDSEHSIVNAVGEYMKYRIWLKPKPIILFHDSRLPYIVKSIEILRSMDTLLLKFESDASKGGFGIASYERLWKQELGKYKGEQ